MKVLRALKLYNEILSLVKTKKPDVRNAGKPNKYWSFDNPNISLFNFFEKMTSMWDGGDTTVTDENVLSIDAWWRGVRVISDSISGLPANIYQRTNDGKIVEHHNHLAYRILNIESSPSQGHFTWKTGVIDSTLNTGDSFSFIIRDKMNRVKYLIPLWPGAVNQWRVDKDYRLSWKIDGIESWVEDENIFHIMGFSQNGITGLNPVETHRMSLSASRGAMMYAENLMKNGAFLSGVIESDIPVGKTQHEMLKNSWHDAYGGAANTGKVPILDRGMKYRPIALSPVDAEWLGMRKDMVAVVSRILGVPMHMLSELDNATYSNIEHQSQEFERYSLRPWIERLESEIRRKLFTKEEIATGYYVSFDTDALLKGNLETQAAYSQTMFNIGALNQDEIRARMNKGPIENGHRYFIMGNNMVPADRIDEVIDSSVRGTSISEQMRKQANNGQEINK